jgi:hypothetical protein
MLPAATVGAAAFSLVAAFSAVVVCLHADKAISDTAASAAILDKRIW